MARDLVASGAGVAAVQVASRWASTQMPAYYARAELVGTERAPGFTARSDPLTLDGRADDGGAILTASTTDAERGAVKSPSEAGYRPRQDHGGLPGRPVSRQAK